MKDYKRKIIDAVEGSIEDTVTTLRENELYFLNESDVQAFLTNEIKEKLGDIPNGEFNKTSSLVHCQVGIFDGGKHQYKPDIVIFRPDSFELAGKGDTFSWSTTVFCNIEIKFNFYGTKGKVLEGIKTDYNKFIENTRASISYIFYLDRMNNINSDEDIVDLLGIERSKGDYNLSICYASQKEGFVINSLIKKQFQKHRRINRD